MNDLVKQIPDLSNLMINLEELKNPNSVVKMIMESDLWKHCKDDIRPAQLFRSIREKNNDK